jgi:hypothetical protein
MERRTIFAPRKQCDTRRKDKQGNAANRPCPPSEEAVIAAYKDGVAVAAIARRAGKTPRAIEWMVRKAGLRSNPHKRPSAQEPGDAPFQELATAFRRQDLAFQRAMARAVGSGQENPARIGVYKDKRPLDARMVFEPVPDSSGCTSPAGECADPVPPVDRQAQLVRAEPRIGDGCTHASAEMGDAEIG